MNQTPLPYADLRARVLEAARQQPSETRVGRRRASILAVALGFAAYLGIASLSGGPGLDGKPALYVVMVLGGWLLVAGLASWVALLRGRSVLGRPVGWYVAASALTPTLLFVAAIGATSQWHSAFSQHAPLAAYLRCALITTLLALGPFAAFVFLHRGGDPVAPAMTGGSLGAAAGAWGAVGIAVLCPCGQPLHVLLSHVLPVLVIAIAGMLVGARALSLRAQEATGSTWPGRST